MSSSPSNPSPTQKTPEKRTGHDQLQLIWGIALFLMGVGVIFRIPAVMDRIAATSGSSSEMYFLRFCFYLIAVILLGGGIKKINKYWFDKKSGNNPGNRH